MQNRALDEYSFTLDEREVSKLNRPRIKGISAFLVPRNDATAQTSGGKVILRITSPSQLVEGKSNKSNIVFLEAGFNEAVVGESFFGLEELQNRTIIGEWSIKAEDAIGGVRRSDDANGFHDLVLAIRLSVSHV